MLKTRRIEDFDGPFNQLIADRMRELEFQSLEAFAEYAGIGYTTLYNLVLGRVSASGAPVKPSVDTLSKLSNALEKPLGELVYLAAPEGFGAPSPFVGGFPQEVAVWPTNTPVPENAPGWGSFNDAPEHTVVEHAKSAGRHFFGYRIRGNAMAAGPNPIRHNDIVIVDGARSPREGEPGIFRLRGGMFVCRMLSHEHGLVAANPIETDSEPVLIPEEEVTLSIGPVVRMVRDLD